MGSCRRPAPPTRYARQVTLNRIAFDDGMVLSELRVRRPTLESHYLASVERDHR
jgi:hypothetical protein